jgi:hypothetical protein
MLKWLNCWLTFALALASETPFWKAKPKVYERIQEREVIVRVNSSKNPSAPPAAQLDTAGGGQVNAPCAFVFKTMQNYEQLTKASDDIKAAHYAAKEQTLKLRVEAFAFKADLLIEVKPVGPPDQAILYRILQGPMTGYRGRVELQAVAKNNCEVGFSGEYQFDKFPIPKLFLDFGLEVIFQRMAIRLRGYVEDEYKASMRKVQS